jgi:phosphopantothenoylcysteine synthetase/decarboxylase
MPTNLAPTSRGPLHLLVTAGPTREMIDHVRDWGNIFSGKTGLDLALAFLDLGDVTLLTSNEAHAREFDGYRGKGGMLGVETFRSHADLKSLLEERMADPVHVVAMTAAVADYAPAGAFRVVQKHAAAGGLHLQPGQEVWIVENVTAPKVKSSHDEIAILSRRTLKLVDQFRTAWNYRGILIKFKLEVGLTDEQLLAVASASRTASGANLMVANTLAMARPADGSEGGAYMIDDAGAVKVGRQALANAIVSWVRQKL